MCPWLLCVLSCTLALASERGHGDTLCGSVCVLDMAPGGMTYLNYLAIALLRYRWVDDMYNVIDGVGIVSVAYFVAAIVVGNFMASSLFLAILADSFAATHMRITDKLEAPPSAADTARNNAPLLPTRQSCLQICTQMRGRIAMHRYFKALSRAHKVLTHVAEDRWVKVWSKACTRISEHRFFTIAVNTFIVLNAIELMRWDMPIHPKMEYEPYDYQSPASFYAALYIDGAITLAFVSEMIIRVGSCGLRLFLSDRFLVFEFVIVCASLLEYACRVAGLLGSSAYTILQAATLLRGLRILRTFRFMRSWPIMASTMAVLVQSIPAILNLSVLSFFVVVIWALLGVQLFGGVFPRPDRNYTEATLPAVFGNSSALWRAENPAPRANFDSVHSALLSVFIVLTGENWNDVMAPYAVIYPHLATTFFMVLYVLGNLIIFNLVISIILANLQAQVVTTRQTSIEVQSGANDETEGISIEQMPTSALPSPEPDLRHNDAGNSPTRDLAVSLLRSVRRASVIGQSSGASQGSRWVGRLYRSMLNSERLSRLRASSFRTRVSDASLSADQQPKPIGTWLRDGCTCVALSPAFECIAISLVCASLVQLLFDWPGYASGSTPRRVLDGFDLAFTLLFTLEAVVRGAGVGILHPRIPPHRAYLRDSLGHIDTVVLVTAYIALLAPLGATGHLLTSIRALRVMRVLRVLSKLAGVRRVVWTLIQSTPAIGALGIIALVVVLIFGIAAQHLFGGRMGACLDPRFSEFRYGSRVTPGQRVSLDNATASKLEATTDFVECHALPRYNLTRHDSLGQPLNSLNTAEYELFYSYPRWANVAAGSFDNIGSSLVLLVEMATGEGWPAVMFALLDIDFSRKYVTPWPLIESDANSALDIGHLPAVSFIFTLLWLFLGHFVS